MSPFLFVAKYVRLLQTPEAVPLELGGKCGRLSCWEYRKSAPLYATCVGLGGVELGLVRCVIGRSTRHYSPLRISIAFSHCARVSRSLQEAVAAASKGSFKDGEGFVVCDASFRRVKIKCPS